MKSLIRKPRFLGYLMLALSVAVFFIDLAILRMSLTGYLSGYSFWSLSERILTYANSETIYGLCLVIAFFASLIVLAAAAVSLLRNKSAGFYAPPLYFLAFAAAVIAFQLFFGAVGIAGILLSVLDIVLIAAYFVLLAFRKSLLRKENSGETAKEEPAEKAPARNTRLPAALILILDIIAVLSLISFFFLPLYSFSASGADVHSCVLSDVLLSGDSYIDDSVLFLVFFALTAANAVYFASCLPYFFSDKGKFVRNSRVLMALNIISSLAFFLTGLSADFIYAANGVASSFGLSYIPSVSSCVFVLAYSVLKGLSDRSDGTAEPERKERHPKAEPLIYVWLISAVTVFALFLNIIKVNVSYGTYSSIVEFTGIRLLSDYAGLGSSYQILAYLLTVMLICSGIGLLLSMAGYFSNYRFFGRIAKTAVYVNVFFVFLFGISGFYFKIAQAINSANMQTLLTYYGVELPSDADYTYTITTDAIYALLADIAILIVMMLRKALDAGEETLPENSRAGLLLKKMPGSGFSGTRADDGARQEEKRDFDPCPAFTELDSEAESYKNDLALREKSRVRQASLSGLVKFVVGYAADSRLHLSYSNADIATFVAGLGSSRLTILQGMSGTGKTSLPKIFSEAICGNCDIIEVESSWKDKNELLGYYNEFSMKYTPKKFTQALYKAALNREIPTFIVLDEMNLSRIEYYFSDFLSLMENEEEKREIRLLNIKIAREEKGRQVAYKALRDGHTLKVPPNVWFIGTANRDESTFVISDKVYDRAQTMNFNKRAPKVRDYSDPIPPVFYDYKTIRSLFDDARKNGTFDAENNSLIKAVEQLLSPYNISFGNRILKQIEDFVDIYQQCFPLDDVRKDAVETILLSKVVSKLEVKTIENKDDLVRSFESLGLARCADFVRRLDED